MAVQEDYILRLIAMLGEFLRQVTDLRAAGKHEQAMVVLMQAQEKLFGGPFPEIAALSLDEQLQRLSAGFSAKEARERQIGYALLLKEAGICYAYRGNAELAAGAFKMALHIVLGRMAAGEAADADLVKLSGELLASIPPEQIDPPLKELLENAR